MGDNYYKCDSCNKKFTRKYNANRHIKNIHDGKAVAFNVATGMASNAKINFLQGNQDGYNDNSLNQIDLEKEDEEQKILDICGEMIGPLDELEKLITNMSEDEKLEYLCNVIVHALATSNPIKHLHKTIVNYKSMNGRIRIANYLSVSRNIPPATADSILSTMIKNSSYYKYKKNLVK